VGDALPTGTKEVKLAIVAFVLSIVLFVSVIGTGLFLRSNTVHANCEAIRTNNAIFREFVQHSKERSIAVIRSGEITDVSIAAVRAFYDPVLARIDAVHC
jgi:hypothetical protein